MAALATTPTQLAFDLEEMRRWGFIWRIGTKVRRGATSEDDDASTDAEPGTGYETESNEDASEAENVAQPANALVAAVTEVIDANQQSGRPGSHTQVIALSAAAAGLPSDWSDIVDEAAKYPSAFSKKQGMDFGLTFDRGVATALSKMLGDIEIVEYKGTSKDAALQPPKPECIEVGPARVIGGVRPQNFDVAYRPDGVRIAYDSKTLNDSSSIQKNWQNMVNDLATEATTVHTRFPYAVVAFIVAVPRPALRSSQEQDMIRTLERLATREQVIDQSHLAEAIAFVVWDPLTGEIDPDTPKPDSILRYEKFMTKIHHCYSDRYKGLPPHDK